MKESDNIEQKNGGERNAAKEAREACGPSH
jgi:hypothetical protein